MCELIGKGFWLHQLYKILPRFRHLSTILPSACNALLKAVQSIDQRVTGDQILSLIEDFGMWNYELISHKLIHGVY